MLGDGESWKTGDEQVIVPLDNGRWREMASVRSSKSASASRPWPITCTGASSMRSTASVGDFEGLRKIAVVRPLPLHKRPQSLSQGRMALEAGIAARRLG